MFKVSDITVNYLANPCGIDKTPKISYKLTGLTRGDEQSSCEIKVFRDGNGECPVFDTGVTEGKQELFIPVTAKLEPVKRYNIYVKVKNKAGETAEDSGFFVTGKLGGRWSGRWITASFITNYNTAFASPYIRGEFGIEKEVKSAYLSICGLGYFVSYVNGRRTGDDMLSPAFTRYDAEDMYVTYDVTDKLTKGKNALGVMLGNGWYNCFAEDPWNTNAASWRGFPRMISEIKVNYKDGSTETFSSDSSYKCAPGPIIFNGIRNGEHYDARLEKDGWNEADYDDSDWAKVKLMRAPGGRLEAMEMEPIRQRTTFAAVKKTKTENGWLFDFGQNQAGICRYKLYGKAGSEYTFRYSDVLDEKGELNMGAIGGFIRSHGFQTDKYIKKTDGMETWEPVFVYHGFQYMEMSGLDYEPDISDATAVTMCTDVKQIGKFACSDELLNKIQHLCVWSTISNLHSIPTDCPHREKNGWTGDSSISSEQMLTNFGTRAILKKWCGDIRTAQRPAGQIPSVVPSTGWGYNGLNGPDWSSALVNVPYNIYLYNADTDVLRENYDTIKRNCDFMESMTEDYTVNYGLGDWCAPFEGPAISRNMGAFKCPTEVTDTAFFYNAARLTARMAKVFGYEDDEKYYGELAAKIRKAFRDKYFDKETYTVKGDCQTSQGAMLYFGLYEPDEYQGILDNLLKQIDKTDGHLDFGILGCKFVMHSLGRAGKGKVGEAMIAQRTFPGCQRWIDLGATTLWECWNGGGSHNHHMFSDLSSFLYKYVGGIEPDDDAPGFKHTVMRPAIDCGMEYAEASHESMFGTVACRWEHRDGKYAIHAEVPFGCTATLCLPAHFEGKLSEGGTDVRKTFECSCDGEYKTELKGGSYDFTA